MNDITVALMIAALLFYVATLVIARRKELQWIALIIDVCAMASLIMDDSIATEHLLLLIVPVFFALMMTGLKVMDLLDRW